MPLSTPPLFMRVLKYIPDRMYGFLGDASGSEVFFHLRVFHPQFGWTRSVHCATCHVSPCDWSEFPPPPILGEKVSVDLDVTAPKPRALVVHRIETPVAVLGLVDTFDPLRGYGFVRGKDGITYHLHRSEVTEGRLPLPGQEVMFYAGVRKDRPRACHVRICRG
jgi:cold shock CspA family protein